MPDQNPCQSNPRKYPALSGMGTEELERLLAQELDMPEDEEPDLAFLEAMTKTLRERKAEAAPRNGDVEEALERFHQRLEAEAREPAPQSGASQPVQARRRGSRSGVSRLLRNVAAVLAVVLAVCGTASAFGVNIFQTVAEWTDDAFRFGASNSNTAQLSVREDPFRELRTSVSNHTDTKVIPNWWPAGTAAEATVDMADTPSGPRLYCMYASEKGEFSILIQIHDSLESELSFGFYQKSPGEVLEYQAGGIVHYIFMNNNKYCTVWINDFVEVAIQGDLTEREMKHMIDSVYKE